MISPDRFIASCNSWSYFWDSAKHLSDREKGIAFERLTQLYLQTAPEYRTKLQNVWLLRDVPPNVRRAILPPSANLKTPDLADKIIIVGPDKQAFVFPAGTDGIRISKYMDIHYGRP
jgi:hypothetical protein